ncbi:MAG: penicillin-binding transpeptidase domain-containing protein [Kouleothrix sp.]
MALLGGKRYRRARRGHQPDAWFIAIAPVDQPRYAVAVMAEMPRDGAGVGARLAGDVLKAAFDLEGQ